MEDRACSTASARHEGILRLHKAIFGECGQLKGGAWELGEIDLLRVQLERVLDMLTPREKKVLRLRFGFDGLDDNGPRTLENVGRQFGTTRERIRQIEAKALRKLQHYASFGVFRLRLF